MLLTIQEYTHLLEQNHCASYTMISYFSTTTSKRDKKFYHLFDLTLCLKTDQHKFSPYNIHTTPREKVMRVDIKDHKWENASIIYQILSADFTRKCMEIDVENLYVDIGA